MLDDGTAGLAVVRASGGEAIIQDPETALFSSMPRSALNHVTSAQVLPLPQIPVLLLQLIREELTLEPEPARKAPLGAVRKRA